MYVNIDLLDRDGEVILEDFNKIIKHSHVPASSSYSLIFSILLGFALGWAFDSHYHTSPKGVLIGVFSGLCSGFYFLAKIILKGKKNI